MLSDNNDDIVEQKIKMIANTTNLLSNIFFSALITKNKIVKITIDRSAANLLKTKVTGSDNIK